MTAVPRNQGRVVLFGGSFGYVHGENPRVNHLPNLLLPNFPSSE